MRSNLLLGLPCFVPITKAPCGWDLCRFSSSSSRSSGIRNVSFLRVLYPKAVPRFARNPEDSVASMNVWPFEMHDLLFPQSALERDANDEMHVWVSSSKNIRDLFARVDCWQCLVIAGRRWQDFRVHPGETKKTCDAGVLVGDGPLGASALPQRCMKIEQVLAANFICVCLLHDAQELRCNQPIDVGGHSRSSLFGIPNEFPSLHRQAHPPGLLGRQEHSCGFG